MEFDWNKLIVVLIGAIIPAIVSYIVSKMNIKNEKENINKQIEAEIKRVKTQYKLAQKKDNKNYLNKLKVEKLAELYPAVVKFTREINKISEFTVNSINYFENSIPLKEDELKVYKKIKKDIENKNIDHKLINKISVLAVYFPEIKKQWDTILFRYALYTEVYFEYLLEGEKDLENEYNIYDELYEGIYDVPEKYDLAQYKRDIKDLNHKTKELVNLISSEINQTMNILGGDS